MTNKMKKERDAAKELADVGAVYGCFTDRDGRDRTGWHQDGAFLDKSAVKALRYLRGGS